MSIKNAIKQGLTVTKYSTAMVSVCI